MAHEAFLQLLTNHEINICPVTGMEHSLKLKPEETEMKCLIKLIYMM